LIFSSENPDLIFIKKPVFELKDTPIIDDKTLTLFIPAIKSDTERLNILLHSLEKFMNPENIKILFLTPKSDLNLISKMVKSRSELAIPFEFATEEEVYPYNRHLTSGWNRQQALKLLISDRIDTEFYFIFDCDNFAIKNVSINDFVVKGKAVMELTNLSDFQDTDNIARIIGMETIDRNGKVMNVTPAILSTEITRKLLKHIIERNCESCSSLPAYLYKQISTRGVTEYILYYQYALYSGMLWDKHFKGKIHSDYNVWFAKDCLEWDPKKVFSGKGYFCVFQSNFGFPPTIIYDQIRDYIGITRDKNVPKISCLMVTKDRLEYVKKAIKCFQNQTYPNKELIIICDYPDGVKEYVEKIKDSRILHYQLPSKSKTLGELRNFSTEKSSGELVTQWDDDDWYHPSRISIQYDELKSNNADACLLSQWFMAWPDKGRYTVSKIRKDGWEGTMLVKKSILPKYSNLRKSEDTELMKILFKNSKVHIITNEKYYFLYIYLVHGNNTWDAEHFDVMFNCGNPVHKEFKDSKKEELSKKICDILCVKYEGYDELQHVNLFKKSIFWRRLFLHTSK
jgi:glycosyltransferase involved in cell wall biosynthesis